MPIRRQVTLTRSAFRSWASSLVTVGSRVHPKDSREQPMPRLFGRCSSGLERRRSTRAQERTTPSAGRLPDTVTPPVDDGTLVIPIIRRRAPVRPSSLSVYPYFPPIAKHLHRAPIARNVCQIGRVPQIPPIAGHSIGPFSATIAGLGQLTSPCEDIHSHPTSTIRADVKVPCRVPQVNRGTFHYVAVYPILCTLAANCTSYPTPPPGPGCCRRTFYGLLTHF